MMKAFVLVFTLLFSYSILADCCNSVEAEDCKTELIRSGCEGSDSHSGDQEMCHCTFACSPKILENHKAILPITFSALYISFPRHLDSFKNLKPSPFLRPPIS